MRSIKVSSLALWLVMAIMVLTMTAMRVQAAPGNAAQFNSGANSFIAASSSTELKTFSALTLEAWIRPNGGGEWATIMGKQYNPGDGNPWYSYRLYAASANPSEQGFPRRVGFNIAPVSTGGEVGVASTTVVQNDVWTHVAGVYDGASMKIYINGALENTVDQTGDLKASDLPMYIGKAPWTNYNNYNGQMDELRIWNVARTQAQIQYAMNRSLEGNEAGLVAYWPFNDAAGSPTAADASQYDHLGTLYNGAAIVAGSTAPVNMDFIAQTGMPVGMTIVSNPITVAGISSPAAISITGGEYSVSSDGGTAWTAYSATIPATVSLNDQVKVRQTSSGNYSTLTTATLTIGGLYDEFFYVTTAAAGDPHASGLVSWWKAENTAYDSVGGNHGTAQGGTTYAAGPVGQAFDVDGVNGSYVSVPDNISLRITSDITVSAFIKRTGVSNGSYGHIITKGAAMIEGDDVPSSYLLQIDDSDQLVGGFETADGDNALLTGPAMTDLSRFHHIVYVRAGTSHTMYLDGEQVATASFTGVPGDTEGLALTIGAVRDGSGYVDVFNGLIDEVKIFNRALSASEVAKLAGMVPDAFTFTAQTNMPVNTAIVSNPVTLTGIIATTISITGVPGGEYQINGGSWTSGSGTVNNGDSVKVRQTSSAINSTLTTATLTIGGVSGAFDVTTAASGDPHANGLVSWWKAENNAFDSVGGNHGSAMNGATYATGKVGQAFSLDGVDDYVKVNASSSLDIGLSDGFSINAWINPHDISQNQPLIEWNNGSSWGSHFWISVPASGGGPGSLFANIFDTSGNAHHFSTTTNILTADVYQHVAVTYDKNTGLASLYLNGTVAASQNLGIFDPQTSYDLYIGLRPNGSVHFNGLIEEVQIFNRALTALEVSTLAGTKPDSFSFTPQTAVALSTPVVSNAITVTGISSPAAISITGGAYAISTDGVTWGDCTSSTGTVSLNNQVKVCQTSSGSYSTTTTATLTIGGVEGTFSVTTIPWPVTFTDIFASGIDPAHWTVNAGAYTIDSIHGDIRMSKLAGPGAWGSIVFNHEIRGDFDISVDFRDANLWPRTGPANQIQLNLAFGVQYVANRREDTDSTGNCYSVWRDPNGSSEGVTATTDLSGTLRITRVGSTVSFYANGTRIYQNTFNNAPVTHLSLSLQNNGTEDAISVTFDNLVIKASNIVIPDASGLLSWWRAEGNALDSYGFYNGVLVGGAGYTTGKIGESFNLDGSSGSVDLGNWFNLQSFTISMWVNPGATQQQYTDIIDNNHTGSRSWVMQQDDTNTNRYLFAAAGGAFPNLYFTLPADRWTHVVVTRDAATRDGTVYLDGVPLPSVTGSSDITYDGSQNLHLGRHHELGRYWNGKLDEVKIFNRAITSCEAANLAGTLPDALSFISQNGMPLSTTIESNPGIVTGITSPAAISITGGEYAVSTDCGATWGPWLNSGTVALGNLVKVRQTSSGSNSTTTTATLTIGGTSGDFSVTTAAAGDPNSTGLLSWWKGENNAFDSVGGNHGILSGGVLFAAGQVDQAFNFDGADDYLFVQNTTNINGGTEATYSARVLPQSTPGTGEYFGIFGAGDSTLPVWTSQQCRILYWNTEGSPAGTAKFYMDCGTNDDTSQASAVGRLTAHDYPTGSWHSVVGVFNNGALDIYVNGVLDNGTIMEWNPGSFINRNAENILWIGAIVRSDQSLVSTHFNGLIDEVKIYNRALSSSEASKLAGTYPDPFGFTPILGAARSTVIESLESITVAGINQAAPISITGGEYRVNSGDWTSGSGTVAPGATVRVRLTSSSGYYDTKTATLNIGGREGTFSVTTLVDTVKPVVTGFSLAAAESTNMSVGVTSFIASDNDTVSGYLVTTSSTPPSAADAGWSATAPTSVILSMAGNNTLYAWAKDPDGNVSEPLTDTILLMPVRRDPSPYNYYNSISAACSYASGGETIKALAVTVPGSVTITGKTLTIKGGHADGYASQPGVTTIQGTLTIGTGSLTVDRVAIR